MTDTTKTQNEAQAPADDYTARMDRMLNSLQNKSQSTRIHQLHATWIWLSIGLLVSVGLIFLALSVSPSGFQGAFHTLYN